MTPELPDDLKAWPADDFKILGVSRTAAEDDIRRAYTRLIRRFKPEHFPEHFQRIREAYDTCRMQAQWYRMMPKETEEPEAKDPAAEPTVELPAWSPPLTVETSPDAVDVLWQQAVKGDLDAAYTGLFRECKASDRHDLPLRLYWLLNLEPGLDPDRTRHHWLEEALMRSRLAGPAAELYRRELEIDPKTALLDTYFDVLGIDAEPADLLAMARSRIQAAGRDERFVVLERDLNRIKPRIGIDGDIAWLALVVNACEWAACSPAAAELRSTCEREMKSLEHLALQHSYFFDRVDECENWRSNSYTSRWHGSLKDFVQLIHQGWAGYGTLTAEQLRIGLAEIVREPAAAISRLDHLFRQDRPELQLYALSMLERHRVTPDDAMSENLIRGLARRLFQNLPADDYERLRYRVLDWLLRDSIHPDEFAEACESDPESKYRTLGQKIRSDLSLRIVWLAVDVNRSQRR